MARTEDLAPLERQIGYVFQCRELLERALTHKSYVNENPADGLEDNERLEFLGDAVLDLVVGHLLMESRPALREGELSMLRAHLVSESGLHGVAERLALGQWLRLGRGEERTGGREKPSLLADACEALIAAVYLDGGFDAAHSAICGLFFEEIRGVNLPGQSDYKTRLQEHAQALYKHPPYYEVVGEQGPDHDKTFEVAVSLQGAEAARATGKSKKEAEQRAAEAALSQLAPED